MLIPPAQSTLIAMESFSTHCCFILAWIHGISSNVCTTSTDTSFFLNFFSVYQWSWYFQIAFSTMLLCFGRSSSIVTLISPQREFLVHFFEYATARYIYLRHPGVLHCRTIAIYYQILSSLFHNPVIIYILRGTVSLYSRLHSFQFYDNLYDK